MFIANHRNRARLAGPKRLHESYPTPQPLLSWRMRDFFKADTHPVARNTLAKLSPDCQGHVFVATDGLIHQLTFRATGTTPDATVVTVGSISDKLDSPQLIYLPELAPSQWFVSLAANPAAAPEAPTLFATASAPVPDQANPPLNPDGAADPPGNNRLHFPGNDLRFGLFPVMFPVPNGVNVPPAHPVHEPFPADLIQACPALEEWRRAISWNISHNNGLSANAGGPMFDPTEFDTMEPASILASFPLTSGTVQVPFSCIAPGTPLHISTMPHVEDATNTAWDRIVTLLPPEDRPAPTLVHPTGSTNDALISVLHRAIESQGTVLERALRRPTHAEQEVTRTTATNQAIYSLLFASRDNDQPEPTFRPGLLSRSFQNVLQHSKTDAARDALSTGITETINRLQRGDSDVGATLTLRPAMFDSPLTTAIRTARFYSTSFNPDYGSPEAFLSVLSFATPTSAITQRAHADQDATNYASVGNESKDNPKNHKLFTGGRINNLADVVALLSNLLATSNSLATNAPSAELYSHLYQLYKLLGQSEYRAIIEVNRERQARVAHHLASHVQEIFAAYATVAKLPDLVEAAKEGLDLDPQPFLRASAVAASIVANVHNHIRTSVALLETDGVLWNMLHPNKGANALTQAPDRPRKHDRDDSHKPAEDLSVKSAALAANRNVGFLTTTISDPVSIRTLGGTCPVFIQRPNAALPERLCIRHCLRGWACGFGTECSFAHPATLSSMDEPTKAKLIQWVNSTPELSFAPGEGPDVSVEATHISPDVPGISAARFAPHRPLAPIPTTAPVPTPAALARVDTATSKAEPLPLYPDELAPPARAAIAPIGGNAGAAVRWIGRSPARAAIAPIGGNAGAAVRWIGRPHVGAHRAVPRTQSTCRCKAPDSAVTDLEHLSTASTPARFHATSTQAVFSAFHQHDNHSSILVDPERTHAALIKEYLERCRLLLTDRSFPFRQTARITPYGLINLSQLYKLPRILFDGSFRPQPRCTAITDMTAPTTEPTVTYNDLLVKCANIRAGWTNEAIYISDDDVSGSFSHSKLTPIRSPPMTANCATASS